MRKSLFTLLIVPALVTMGMAQKPHHPRKQSQDAPVIKRGDTPSYHAGPPRGTVPPTLNPAQAARIRLVAERCPVKRAFEAGFIVDEQFVVDSASEPLVAEIAGR